MSKSRKKTTVYLSTEHEEFMEQYCFERGFSFTAWVRQRVAELYISESEREAQLRAISGTHRLAR